MGRGSAILVIGCLAWLGQKKDPAMQILVSCHHKFGDSFPRQATEMDLSRLLDFKAPRRICGGFLLQNLFYQFTNTYSYFYQSFEYLKEVFSGKFND